MIFRCFKNFFNIYEFKFCLTLYLYPDILMDKGQFKMFKIKNF